MKTAETKNKVQKQKHPLWYARDSPVGTLNEVEFCGDIHYKIPIDVHNLYRPQEGFIMETKNKSQSEIKFRLTAAEKAEIQLRAQKAGTNVSEFIRTCCLSDEKIIFLEEGAKIAGKLCEIYTKFDLCAKRQFLGDDTSVQLSNDIETVSSLLVQLTEMLTAVRSDEKEEE